MPWEDVVMDETMVESVALAGSGYVVVLRLTGEREAIQVQTRWKDRDGEPKVVEASHLSRTELAGEAIEPETSPDGDTEPPAS